MSYHPLVNLVYFLFVIGFSCFYIHPLCQGISLFCGLGWAVCLPSRHKIGKSLWLLLPVLGVTILMNPIFNHQGVTVLCYLPGGNPLTAESILYGILAGSMLAGLILWFLCFREVITEDKIIYLFGRIAPSLALLFSMTLRFVPRFLEQFQKVHRARKGRGKDGGIKEAMAELSGVTTWALENAIDTADSMKARGYGLPGRTFYHNLRFDKRDGIAMGVILLLGGVVLAGGWMGQLDFYCFPQTGGSGVSLANLPYLMAFLLLCSYPLCLELWEVRRWNSIRHKD